MKLNHLSSFAFSFILLLSSCLNEYEKDCLGYYEVKNFELNDGFKTIPGDLPTLTLKKDKTFLLAFKNKIIQGKWDAGDNGDWRYVTFSFDGKNVEGRIGIKEIWILNPGEFYCPFLKTLKFAKVSPPQNS